MHNENKSDFDIDIADEISKAIESKVADEVKNPDYLSDISRAVQSRATKDIGNTDFAEDIGRAVVNNVSRMDADAMGGASTSFPLDSTGFSPELFDTETKLHLGAETKLHQVNRGNHTGRLPGNAIHPERQAELHHTSHDNYRNGNAHQNRNVPPQKPKGLWAKFKNLSIGAKVAIILGILTAIALLVLGLWLLYGTPTDLPQELERPIIETPPPAGVQSISIFFEDVEVTTMELHVDGTATLIALVDRVDFEEEIIWTNNREDIIEITSTNESGDTIRIRGLGVGTSRLTATVGNVEAVVIIRVGEVPPVLIETVDITRDGNTVGELDLYVGESITLQLIVVPRDSEESISATSSDPAVLRVVQDDDDETEVTVTGVSAGNATVIVYAGSVRTEASFYVSVELIETAHPFAVGLRDFFEDAEFATHATLISNMPGATGDVVMASKQLNPANWDGEWGEPQALFRFMYMHNDTLRSFELTSYFYAGGGLAISDNNYLASISADGTFSETFVVHLFNAGELQIDAIVLREFLGENRRFMYNDREIEEYEFDNYLRHYGLDGIIISRPDDTTEILEMTVIVEVTR